MYKILLVEDDPTITEVLERQLAKWGYEASHVTDFQHVLETFVQQAPHLVLLDISLPFYDGYHWCGEIRKISKNARAVHLLRQRQHEPCDGAEHGRRRFPGQAL